MYSIVFTKQAIRSMQKLPASMRDRVRDRLEQVASAPYAQHPNVTKLQGRDGYRLRIGDWRVLYDVQDEKLVVLVLKVAPRGEVYR